MRMLRHLLLFAVAFAAKVPKALLINLPRHRERYESVKEQFEVQNVRFLRAPACDGKLLTDEQMKQNVTALGRLLMTRGMMGCFLSHRSCWQKCVEMGEPVLVFEDDVVLADDFNAVLSAAIKELPDDWDVLLVGALGAVHPRYYWINLLHSCIAGGMRWPRNHSKLLHEPLRPFGTHAYAVSPAGARKLLASSPKASYHVDVIAWGTRGVRLFAVHPLLAKQTHGDTTIGGAADRSWLPNLVVDDYTGTDFAWAWNAPLVKVGKLLLTSGRVFFTGLLLIIASVLLRHSSYGELLLYTTLGYSALFYLLIRALTWPQRRLPPLKPLARVTV